MDTPDIFQNIMAQVKPAEAPAAAPTQPIPTTPATTTATLKSDREYGEEWKKLYP